MIVDAALPLLLEHGEMVTTRQIADAAGIAEGTIFRAFADKDASSPPSSTPPSTRRRSSRRSASIDPTAAASRRARRRPSSISAARHRRLADAVERRPAVPRPRAAARCRQPAAGRAVRGPPRPAGGRRRPTAAQLLRALTLAADPPDASSRSRCRRARSSSCSSTACTRRPLVLIRLLRDHLAALQEACSGWSSLLQAVQTTAALLLPTLNAHIIDNGVLPGDTGYIWRVGADHARRHPRPGRLRRGRRVLRRHGSRWASAATCGQPVPPGDRVLGPRGRHVRRAVADHPHHQRRAAGADARRDGLHDGDRRARSRWSSA